ncbi:hypothetical protein C8R43DRAFT_1118290 [Mycena crocata]|nr:hypothetical protein C8R43DRAFT_1118290 [Mycena crocata]
MEQLVPYKAILLPADGHPPSVVDLMTSPIHCDHISGSRMPHPEPHMDFVEEASEWKYLVISALDGMNKSPNHSYILFYPTISRDGMPFLVNEWVRGIQGRSPSEASTWRGSVLIAKTRHHNNNHPFTSLMDVSMADFPILKNFMASNANSHHKSHVVHSCYL